MPDPIFDVDVDTDGAIREAEERVEGDSRAAFFRKAAVGGGAALAGSSIFAALPEVAAGKPSRKQDIAILNYALTLEYLETAFYEEAVASNALTDANTLAFAKLVAEHEAAHVKAIRATIRQLRGKPVKRPRFNFQGTTADQSKFRETAFVLENTGVRAYLGQAGRIKSGAILKAAASIVTVEARHSAAAAILLAGSEAYGGGSRSLAPKAFDTGSSMKRILKEVGATGFIVS